MKQDNNFKIRVFAAIALLVVVIVIVCLSVFLYLEQYEDSGFVKESASPTDDFSVTQTAISSEIDYLETEIYLTQTSP